MGRTKKFRRIALSYNRTINGLFVFLTARYFYCIILVWYIYSLTSYSWFSISILASITICGWIVWNIVGINIFLRLVTCHFSLKTINTMRQSPYLFVVFPFLMVSLKKLLSLSRQNNENRYPKTTINMVEKCSSVLH